ncbi:MAG TPA: hypothetical protein VFJ59_01095, partial [Pseudolabrys sp.]|nr:hypothetical protein [Pseudolabrys sp.]
MYGPVRTVVWEGRSREASPYPDQWHLAASDVRNGMSAVGESGRRIAWDNRMPTGATLVREEAAMPWGDARRAISSITVACPSRPASFRHAC